MINIIKLNTENLKRLFDACEECNKLIIDHILCKNKSGSCDKIYLDEQEELKKFWIIFNGEELGYDELLNNIEIYDSLKKMLYYTSKWGMSNPLIIPTTLKLEVTNKCNLKCAHCITGSGNKEYGEMTLSEWKRLIDEAYDLGVNSIGLLGGEPFMFKNLLELSEYIYSKRMLVSISTNATLINENIDKIAESNVKNFAVSIDGMESYHDEFRGVKGAFSNAVYGIKELKKLNKTVTVTIVATKENFNQIEDIIDFMSELGVDRVGVNDLIPLGRGKDINNKCLSQEEYYALHEILKRKKEEYKNKIKVTWSGAGLSFKNYKLPGKGCVISKCGAGLTELTIMSDGYVKSCAFLDKINENVKNKSLEEIWFNSNDLKKYQIRKKLKGKCGKCTYKYACSGCRARAKGYSNDINGEDIRCLL